MRTLNRKDISERSKAASHALRVADQLGAAATDARLEAARSTPTVSCNGTSVALRFTIDVNVTIDDVIQQMRRVVAMHEQLRALRRVSSLDH